MNKDKCAEWSLLLILVGVMLAAPVVAQQTTGVLGSASATTTINGKQLPPQLFQEPKRLASLFERAIHLAPVGGSHNSGGGLDRRVGYRRIDSQLIALSLVERAI